MRFKSSLNRVLIFIFVILLSLNQTAPVMAKSQVKFTENIKSENNTIYFGIEISENSNICGLSLDVKYSESQVKVNKCTTGQALAGGITKVNSTIAGKVILSYISTAPWKEKGQILLIEFEPLSISSKTISIDCTITECIDKECNDISFTYSKKEISNPKYVEEANNQDETPSGNDTPPSAIKPTPNNTELNSETTTPPPVDSQEGTSNPPSEVAPSEERPPIKDGTTSNLKPTSKAKTSPKQDESGKSPKWFIFIGCFGVASLILVVLIKKNFIERKSKNGKK